MIILSTTLFGVFIPTWLVILFWVIVGLLILGAIVQYIIAIFAAQAAQKMFQETRREMNSVHEDFFKDFNSSRHPGRRF